MLIAHIKSGELIAVLGIDWPCASEISVEEAEKDHELVNLFQRKAIPYASVTNLDLQGAVGTDYHDIGYQGASYFLERNIFPIGLVLPESPDHLQDTAEAGFMDALAEKGVCFEEKFICKTDAMTEKGGYLSFKQWWHCLENKPRAKWSAYKITGRS